MLAIVFPNINPKALDLSLYNHDISIYWYGIAYVVGILLAQYIALKTLKKHPIANLTKNDFDKLLLYLISGIIIGGRLGYVFFYLPHLFITDFWEIFNIRGGGLSFHGGLIGVTLAIALYCNNNNKKFWQITDIISSVAPIGIFFGRIANFINAELVGRKTDVAWGVIFPNYDYPCHPSQLYEAFVEGLLLFVIIQFAIKKKIYKNHSAMLTGIFLLFYGLGRFILEFWRQPDSHLGFYFEFITMGQLLSLPMILIALMLIFFKRLKS